MGKKVVFKTHLEHSPKVLEYWWGETPGVFPVSEDGILEGLTEDYPCIHIIKREWKLETIEIDIEESGKDKKIEKDRSKEV